MRRLSHQIYLTVVGVLALFALLVSLAWWLLPLERAKADQASGLAETLAELLPAPERPTTELQAAVATLGRRLRLDVAVFAADGAPLAAFGRRLPSPDPARADRQWVHSRGAGFAAQLRLPDGRLVVARRPHGSRTAHAFFFGSLGLFALALGLGAWPLTRRLTRRLERLRARVEDLGRGELQARAPVEGRDEVAALAASFNRSAERIEALVAAQRRSLAFASHELRSPLARLRVALEMLKGDPGHKAAAERDIAELDSLIDELMETSRLEARGADRRERVDLLALAAEEAARHDLEAGGEPVVVDGDSRLLRRLLRNLLENARRHGGGAVGLHVDAPGGGARIRVEDQGPGVPEAERERIFEPFYRPAGTPETGAGHGLGLALVRQIARAHGGEARVLPREGGGSVFEVTLA
jgi:signal transduction histidine kinase